METSFAAAAAKAGKTVFPSGQQGTLGNSFELGAVVDTKAYCAFLTQHAVERGVTFVTSDDIAFEQCPHSGDITTLLLSNNQRIQCDWVVDATGPQARVIGQALKRPFESWHAYSPISLLGETTEQSASNTPGIAVSVNYTGYQQVQYLGGKKRTATFAVVRSGVGESEAGFREPVSNNCLAVGEGARDDDGNRVAMDVKVGDRIHQHGGGERTVVATRYIRYSGCPDGVMLVTTAAAGSVVSTMTAKAADKGPTFPAASVA